MEYYETGAAIITIPTIIFLMITFSYIVFRVIYLGLVGVWKFYCKAFHILTHPAAIVIEAIVFGLYLWTVYSGSALS